MTADNLKEAVSNDNAFTVKVTRLSSQKNQNGTYYYQILEGKLPEDAQVYGRDGRKGFYSPVLKGNVNEAFTANLLCIPIENNLGTTIKKLVFARSEQEKKETELLERKAQVVRKAARAFSISATKASEMAFERMLDSLLVDNDSEEQPNG